MQGQLTRSQAHLAAVQRQNSRLADLAGLVPQLLDGAARPSMAAASAAMLELPGQLQPQQGFRPGPECELLALLGPIIQQAPPEWPQPLTAPGASRHSPSVAPLPPHQQQHTPSAGRLQSAATGHAGVQQPQARLPSHELLGLLRPGQSVPHWVPGLAGSQGAVASGLTQVRPRPRCPRILMLKSCSLAALHWLNQWPPAVCCRHQLWRSLGHSWSP